MALRRENISDKVRGMDSLDARIVQYQYGIIKLNRLVLGIQRVLNDVEEKNVLPYLHHIVLLCGNVFSINENSFYSRLDILGGFKLINSAQVAISGATSHIPYDSQDLEVKPLGDVPSITTVKRCLKLLEGICNNCLQGYQKRLQNARIERIGCYPDSSNEVDDINELIKKTALSLENDPDLNIYNLQMRWNYRQYAENQEPFTEDKVIDMDLHTILNICEKFKHSLKGIKLHISQLYQVKNIAKAKQDSYLQSLPHSGFLLHCIFMITLRLNEIYNIVRKVGRRVYILNSKHFEDPKFLFEAKSNAFRLSLNEIKEMFIFNKKNGSFIANLTRLSRKGASYEVNSKNVFEFINLTNQGFTMLEQTIEKLDKFGRLWILAELKFRRSFDFQRNFLVELYRNLESLPQKTEKKVTVSRSEQKHDIKQTQRTVKSKGQHDSSKNPTSASQHKNEDLADDMERLKLNKDTHPANDVSSPVSSSSDPKTESDLSPKGIFATSMGYRNSLFDTTNTKTKNRRPVSMILMNNGNTILDFEKLPKDDSDLEKNNSKRHSNISDRQLECLPEIKTEEKLQRPGDESTKAKTEPTASKEERNSGLTRSPSQSRTTSGSSDAKSRTYKSETFSKPLTASQRFQMRLREAAKKGSLVTQQKEVMHSVRYDPNKNVFANSAADSNSVLNRNTHLNAKNAASEAHRLNNRRNSVISSTEDDLNDSFSSVQNSQVSSESKTSDNERTGKRVRFVGVPEYSEQEDAPSSYSSRLLKNFGAFRAPNLKNVTFKKRDQLLKEESLLFKAQVSNTKDERSSPSRSNSLSKFRNRIIH
ncbi:Piso0_005243 [Millerozyma farinosa CBS 7064]|uniref:Piso0_005243 protein n=1 Tax=Pichia sorbitophila (strain ATCC MYA-4447 / BCRC 22081 / CBS 7064 / NBRC 10061 / NRRL Y-12695) TaxID=559304 RepID=G8Y1N1_PICSO|nr:Piso0_005243 [Millerozyma farinosa CBS 7064]